MAPFSTSPASTSKPLSLTRMAFAVVGAGFVFYGARRQTGLLPKLASSAGIALLTRCLGATSLAGAPAIFWGSSAERKPRLTSPGITLISRTDDFTTPFTTGHRTT